MNTDMNGSNGQSQVADLHVQEVIRSAERELHELLQRRAELMERIGTIKQTLTGLANIFGDSVLNDQLLTFLDRKTASWQPGFTRTCRVVLMESGKPLGARFVCEALQRRFPELLERHKAPIASVTTVLSRLADYTEARCSLDANGRRVWEWIADRENPPLFCSAEIQGSRHAIRLSRNNRKGNGKCTLLLLRAGECTLLLLRQ